MSLIIWARGEVARYGENMQEKKMFTSWQPQSKHECQEEVEGGSIIPLKSTPNEWPGILPQGPISERFQYLTKDHKMETNLCYVGLRGGMEDMNYGDNRNHKRCHFFED